MALSPIFELMAHPGYLVVDDVAIASRGPVFSVFIAYRGELSATAHALSGCRLAHLGQPPARAAGGVPRVAPARGAVPGGPAPGRIARGRGRAAHRRPGHRLPPRAGRTVAVTSIWARNGNARRGCRSCSRRGSCGRVRRSRRRWRTRLRAWRAEGQRRIDEVVAAETRYPPELSRRLPDRTHPLPSRRAGETAPSASSRACCANTASSPARRSRNRAGFDSAPKDFRFKLNMLGLSVFSLGT